MEIKNPPVCAWIVRIVCMGKIVIRRGFRDFGTLSDTSQSTFNTRLHIY